MIPFADNSAPAHDNRPHCGVGRSSPLSPLGQTKRSAHINLVSMFGHKKNPKHTSGHTYPDTGHTNALSSPIRTIPSAPELHRLNREFPGSRAVTAGRGISPRPEDISTNIIPCRKKAMPFYRIATYLTPDYTLDSICGRQMSTSAPSYIGTGGHSKLVWRGIHRSQAADLNRQRRC